MKQLANSRGLLLDGTKHLPLAFQKQRSGHSASNLEREDDEDSEIKSESELPEARRFPGIRVTVHHPILILHKGSNYSKKVVCY
mmetsp:Transcript_612/g.1137  ORF Transcript_612/g.1137 Transcript_612/m.1137 type:complete len:84 (-) Transcript_612:88-339(-)